MINSAKKKKDVGADKLQDIMKSLEEEGLPVVRFDLLFTSEGVNVTLGGSTLAKKLFCAGGENYKKLYHDLLDKLEEIAHWTGGTLSEFKDTELVRFENDIEEAK